MEERAALSIVSFSKGAVVTFAGINYLAVVVAAVAAWLGSAVWYMSLSNLYVAALGKTPEQMAADRKKPWAFLPLSMPLLQMSSWPGCSVAYSVTSAPVR